MGFTEFPKCLSRPRGYEIALWAHESTEKDKCYRGIFETVDWFMARWHAKMEAGAPGGPDSCRKELIDG